MTKPGERIWLVSKSFSGVFIMAQSREDFFKNLLGNSMNGAPRGRPFCAIGLR
jgi:hypothetical protein